MASWDSFEVRVPGEELLGQVQGTLETVSTFLEIIKTILNIVKIFLIDVGNPVKPLVEALLAIALELFQSLKQNGIYCWYDVPNPLDDPNFQIIAQGFPGFVERFKAGLLDPRDSNRPQPISGITKGGFILIAVDADNPLTVIKQLQTILRLFGQELKIPRMAPPSGVKAMTAGRSGDPIVNLTTLFSDQPTALVVEWSLPPTNANDPGVSGVVEAFATAFRPPGYLIEKSSKNPMVGELMVDDINGDGVGPVWAEVETVFRDRATPKYLKAKIPLKDNHGDLVHKFEQYIKVDTSANTGTFLLGQLGTFRYIDSDVEIGKTYYYRVRAVSDDLAVGGNKINFLTPPKTVNVIDQVPYVGWPGTDGQECSVGQASAMVACTLPVFPSDFNVIETLNAVFQVAFSLNFHVPQPDGAQFGPDGDPQANATVEDVGKGSLTSLAGPVAGFRFIPPLEGLSGVGAVQQYFEPDPATGLLPELPWMNRTVQRNAARLSNIVISGMLQTNSPNSFRAAVTPVLSVVQSITSIQEIASDTDAGVLQASVNNYSTAFHSLAIRKAILRAVMTCRAFTLGGAPPDWVQISVLRDIAPWSGQILYEIIAKIQALVDAYNGTMAELKTFIDSLVIKIDTLERFIQYLTSLLDFVLSLQFGAYILVVPEISGGTQEWIDTVENAGGGPTGSGIGHYSGGVGFAYTGTDITAWQTVFSMLF